MSFVIDYSHDALRHLRDFVLKDQRVIAAQVDEQLKHQPDVETRNRKPLQDDAECRWELRIGDFRVFYRILPADQTVVVTAIGRKVHNRLFVDGAESEL